MTLQLGWADIAWRLGLTVIACTCIGFNREEHRLAAGLRTTILVGLAAALAMIEVNLLLNINGKPNDSYVVLDLMRLPLGILSGMGFIGAGAILRRDNLVLGVTTAATLWFVTMMGLCFGGGQIPLGLCALGLGFATLTGLKYVEQHCRRDHRANLLLVGNDGRLKNDYLAHLAQVIREAGFKISVASVTITENNAVLELKYEVRWYGFAAESEPPAVLNRLATEFHLARVEWQVIA